MPIRSKRGKVALLALCGALLPLSACGESASEPEGARVEAGAGGDAALDPIPVMGEEVRILAFGDSLFAGYGLKDPGRDSYPSKLEAALRGRGVNARISNAGFSGDTSAAGLQRLGFVLDAEEEAPDLFILELGANDLLRGLSPEETRENLSAILEELKRREVPVLIMGMRAPPNLGPEYQSAFDGLFGELAQEYDTALIPFWLEAIYQDPQLFQDDRKHPTIEGVEELVGATVGPVSAAIPVSEAPSELASEPGLTPPAR